MSYSPPPHIPYTTNMKSNSYCHRINEGLSDVIRRLSISDLSSSGQLMSVPDMIDDAWCMASVADGDSTDREINSGLIK